MIDPPNNLAKIYTDLTAPDIHTMQGHYESLTTVNSDDAATTLFTFVDNPRGQSFLVFTAASTQHPETKFHCLTGLQVMEDPYHHLRKSIITWDGDLI